MSLDFPDSPAVGDLYGSTGTVWRWDGARWASTAGASGPRGRVAYAQTVTSIPCPKDIFTTLTSAVFTASPDRTYKIKAQALFNGSASGGELDIFVNGVRQNLASVPVLNVSALTSLNVEAVVTGLSGSLTVSSGGYGIGAALTAVGNPAYPMFILVEDITYEAGTSGLSSQPTPWVVCTLINGWVHVNAPLSYRKVGDITYMRGACGAGTGVATNMPVGFRPPVFTTLDYLVQGGTLGYATINPNGDIAFNGANTGGNEVSLHWSVTP